MTGQSTVTRVAVVTGGGSGIGEACAVRFAKDGYAVAIIDTNEQGAQRVVSQLQAGGATAQAFIGDVSDVAVMSAFAEDIERQIGPSHALVTSAGILNNSDTVLNMDLDEHQRVWDINYNGTVYTVRAFAPYMQSRKTGAIVTVGSVNSFIQLPLPTNPIF